MRIRRRRGVRSRTTRVFSPGRPRQCTMRHAFDSRASKKSVAIMQRGRLPSFANVARPNKIRSAQCPEWRHGNPSSFHPNYPDYGPYARHLACRKPMNLSVWWCFLPEAFYSYTIYRIVGLIVGVFLLSKASSNRSLLLLTLLGLIISYFSRDLIKIFFYSLISWLIFIFLYIYYFYYFLKSPAW